MRNTSFSANELAGAWKKVVIAAVVALVVVGEAAAYQAKAKPAVAKSSSCGIAGTAIDINGKIVCGPAPSSDLRRFATASSLATYLHMSYTDVVKELVQIGRENQDKQLLEAASGPFTIKSTSPMAAKHIVAGPGKVISHLSLTNEGKQPARVLIDAGTAHLDFILSPAKNVDASLLLDLNPPSRVSVLVAGAGPKAITGDAQAVAAGGINKCLLFEQTFACNYCAGSRCRRGTGGDEASGDCVTKEPQRCLGIFEEPKTCECK